MLDKKQKLFHIFVVVALLLATLGPVVASGTLSQTMVSPYRTQMADHVLQTLARSGFTDQPGSPSGVKGDGSVVTGAIFELLAVSWNSGVSEPFELLAVSWNSGVTEPLELLAVSWNSGVSEPSELLAVSWNSGISVDVSWNS